MIVLVHGCCTDEKDVGEWDELGKEIAKKIKKKEDWEIVVWDWHRDTPDRGLDPRDALRDYREAYENALDQGHDLKIAIAKHLKYKHIHLIGHSTGAKLIQLAAEELVTDYKLKGIEKPFIHLTFLDAFTPVPMDKKTYGFLPNYPNHYSEHYVDRTAPLACPDTIQRFRECFHTALLFSAQCAAIWGTIEEVKCAIIAHFTNELLTNAFNFDLTDWQPVTEEDKQEYGHQWPRYWYKKSVTATAPGFKSLKYGHPLSREGGCSKYEELTENYPKGKQCPLVREDKDCEQTASQQPCR